ncbi:hypothetical protein E2C01_026957 [Portunus trituberculatus]|uniref:Uncharacterized protein n=1 Tax=Portunus trituberculatus TaxID=210409 RepID=A0A5B7EKN5_PORTR|nr:hypothetical protein [Portunus trituberculatus]
MKPMLKRKTLFCDGETADGTAEVGEEGAGQQQVQDHDTWCLAEQRRAVDNHDAQNIPPESQLPIIIAPLSRTHSPAFITATQPSLHHSSHTAQPPSQPHSQPPSQTHTPAFITATQPSLHHSSHTAQPPSQQPHSPASITAATQHTPNINNTGQTYSWHCKH